MSETPQQVAAGKVAIVHYTLRDDAGETLDSSRDGAPLPYLHGSGGIVPGLERALAGRAVGETIQVTVSPEDGYGMPSGQPSTPIARSQAPAQAAPGMQLLMDRPDGGRAIVWVERVDAENVYLTPDHPLAGQTLHFECEVVGVRDATEEERTHGHAHGIDGHAHHHHHPTTAGGKRSLKRRPGSRKRRRKR